jgi:tRNA-splicing endonuclease subunit Sen54
VFHSKSLSHAIWDHTVSRAIVVAARGIHFASIGHSVLQSSHNHESEAPPSKSSQHKQLHLLPEEALYLIERGTLACYWADDSVNEYTEHTRPVISVQQAYTAMLGTVGLSMEKYQVYSYLKRLGYVVTRANPPTSDYPVPQQQACDQPASSSGRWLSLAGMLLGSPFRSLTNLLSRKTVDWWRPLLLSSLTSFTSGISNFFSFYWQCLNLMAGGLYQGIRHILSRSHSLQRSVPSPKAPYTVFFNVYKPITPFRKTTPPQPDYQIVVVE